MKVRVAPQPAKETQATQEGTDPKKLTAGQQATIDYGLRLLGVESIDALYGDSELANMSNVLYRGQNHVVVAELEGQPVDVESTFAFDPNNEEHLKYAYAGLASSIKSIYESINDGSEPGAKLGFKSLDNYVSLINDPEAQRNSQVTIYKSESSWGNPINIEVDYDLSSIIYDGERWGTGYYTGDALIWNIGTDGVNYGITNPGNTMFQGSKKENKRARLWRDAYYDVYEAGNLTPQENLKMLYRSGSINDDGSVTGGLGSLIGFGKNQIVNPYVLHSMVSDRVAEGRINAGRTVVQQPSSILPNPYRTSTGSRR